jgi:hypothetical protein
MRVDFLAVGTTKTPRIGAAFGVGLFGSVVQQSLADGLGYEAIAFRRVVDIAFDEQSFVPVPV